MPGALVGSPVWIGVVVEDMEKQRHFYGDVLGLPEIDAGPDWASFDMGKAWTLELIEKSSLAQYDRPGFQVGFAVGDIDTARAALAARGVEAISPVDHGGDGSSWCYFRDAEGNMFEITQLGKP